MSDDFTKQLQENAVDQEQLLYQQEKQQEKQREEYLKTKEKYRIDLYKEIIEKTKVACLEAVKQGNYQIDNAEKKLVGTLGFYYHYRDDTASYFGIRCFINEKKYFEICDNEYHDFGSIRRGLQEEDILFIVCETMEVDVSNIFDKLQNKKKIEHRLNYIKDSKSIQLFTDLFQSSINNSKIIVVSEIPLWNYRPYKSTERNFTFEIVF